MREPHRLRFLLPPVLSLVVTPGRHQPCIAGCLLVIERQKDLAFLVMIEGPSREQVFEQARRFLRILAKGFGPLSIAAVLSTPAQLAPDGAPQWSVRGGQDTWTIIVGAEIAFAPTSIPPDLGSERLTAAAAQ